MVAARTVRRAAEGAGAEAAGVYEGAGATEAMVSGPWTSGASKGPSGWLRGWVDL